jgi:hypothetical protein
MSLFGGAESGKPLPPTPLAGKHPVKDTPDMFGDAVEHPTPSEKPSLTSKGGDIARKLRDGIDKAAGEGDRSRMYALEAKRLRGSAGAMRTTPDIALQYSEAAEILDGWAKTAGAAPDADRKILFAKPAQSTQSNETSSNLSNNEPVANKQEMKMEAKTVEQLTAELKAAEAAMDAEMKGAGKFRESDKVMNEGGGGYSRSESLSEAAFNRNMPKIKAAKQALFEAVWTPEVTASRRAAWNTEVAKTRSTKDLLALQKKLGFVHAELKQAIALNEGK